MSNTPPQGRNVRVSSAAELRSAIANAQDGDTILIANGEYRNGSPLILNNVDNISIRSESNDPTKVTLRGRSSFTGTGSYDELDDILRIGDCNNVHISGLTLAQAHGYGIKLELDGNSNPNGIYIENCRFIDIGTRHIKGTRDSNSSTKRITGGAIRNCYFENTVTPPSTEAGASMETIPELSI
jgi:pectate lyase